MDNPGDCDSSDITDSGILHFPVVSRWLKPGAVMDFTAARAQLIDHLRPEI